MADLCFLALESGGHLLREAGDGALLLEACANDNFTSVPIPNNGPRKSAYSWEYTRQVRDAELAEARRQQEETERRLKEKQVEIDRLEAERAKDRERLANEAMQIELLALIRQFADLEAEQMRLKLLIRRFEQEQEEELILLYCLPFCA